MRVAAVFRAKEQTLDELESKRAKRMRAGSVQARRKGLAQLVPEYKSIVHIETSSKDDIAFLNQWSRPLQSEQYVAGQTFGIGCKLLSRGLKKGEMTGTPAVTASIGIPWSKTEFIQEAIKIQHPFNDFPADCLDEALVESMVSTLLEPSDNRARKLDEFERRIDQVIGVTSAKERELHEAMPAKLSQLYEGKRFHALHQAPKAIGYADSGIANLVAHDVAGKGGEATPPKPEEDGGNPSC